MNKDKNTWHYSFNFEQSWNNKPTDWTINLNSTELEMIFLDMMSCDLEKEDCSEARVMLENIGIVC
jgi:hypothetical protein